ncbi:uncharacterized protein LOC115342134 isoform X1 [Aquila chrysaetos chrysaetos]|uniref:uncharacterized protein LOC115342134 isoform X1 n=1 Tax=Aquila chrysaetos chrysaetos TaxID=223781 RepID=UPI0011770E37|nr:uncharacterized protein LOC115342134 isoform X1 [Aquila chrysaetos chrysaetos]XP_029872003.1 uncharacterized protein LOC115342134 isoform X1 [Aquila chrysaetos chrysaetos]
MNWQRLYGLHRPDSRPVQSPTRGAPVRLRTRRRGAAAVEKPRRGLRTAASGPRTPARSPGDGRTDEPQPRRERSPRKKLSCLRLPGDCAAPGPAHGQLQFLCGTSLFLPWFRIQLMCSSRWVVSAPVDVGSPPPRFQLRLICTFSSFVSASIHFRPSSTFRLVVSAPAHGWRCLVPAPAHLFLPRLMDGSSWFGLPACYRLQLV